MSWEETDSMRQREQFIIDNSTGLYSVQELAQRYGISRKTAYKWINRYQSEGLAGLGDRSRAPKHCPHQTDEQIILKLLKVRREHPYWGARTVYAYLKKRNPDLQLPSASTIHDIFDRHGAVEPRAKPRLRTASESAGVIIAEAANVLWTLDFKGEFRLGNREYCYPLTIVDAYSRYILVCKALPSTGLHGVQTAFQRLFQRAGLPQALRFDNGVPWVSHGLRGLTRLSASWVRLGIELQRMDRGHPEQNPRHERMHRTLKQQTTRPPQEDFPRQQRCFDRFVNEFNHERPHQGIAQQTPSELYQPSCREYPKRGVEPEYQGHWEQRVVSNRGRISFHGRDLFLSSVLTRETVALEEIQDGIWNVYYYTMLLGRLDESTGTLV